MIEGIASRQACGRRRPASTVNAPSARSSVAAGVAEHHRRHPRRAGPPEHLVRPRRARPRARRATPTRRSTSRASPIATRKPTSPAIAISASATASPPSEQSCTPPTIRSVTRAATSSCSSWPLVEVRRRRRAAAEAVARRPLRSAELGAGRRRAPRCGRRRAGRCPGAASVELVDEADHADHGRRVDVGAVRLVVEADVAADHRHARARRTPRSCRRRPRRTATSPRGARGCRS